MKKLPTVLKRREVLKKTGSVLLATPFVSLVGCDQEDSDTDTTSTSTSDSSSRSSSSSASDTTTIDAELEWASGGTDLITVDYPDDSIFEDSGSCSLTLTERTTEGPCYLGVSESEDISEGQTGLPMMFCMQLVDENCNPLDGYLIEVWHCNTKGIYSGDTSQSDDDSTFAGDFCTDNDAEAEASVWFRGELTTDSSGRVNFKSCFPGWYSGRTIHIHFRVRQEYGGSDYMVSQFCFDDSFTEEICTTHELYKARSIQDTTLASGKDTVFPKSDYQDFLLNIAQNSDGTLLAYKRVMISA
ncbi:intradiol ring-cleavage dioxygenase [Gynuella sunshinyii]|uniref:Protocatechuate 3,4-dioxygenase beta subunit n=1 Tax=Gynuella sunshinyii YC6258 TaxID=1445510 RepID=A0A0C5VAB8_9GAMM|nr:intradiol ring-cleavage dioxygenase [Gynuella sunshinyii]AJQ96250.1 protocatechuate 3,4-dioxygenase beta subunit [Gynuella sunshinyii YC6258]